MRRERLEFLQSWLASRDRKPLVVRGARQVGKTWLIRHFADLEGKNLFELNFEKRPNLASLFASNDPKKILKKLSAALNLPLNPQNSLLFLDEIQACPELLEKLRWFAEDFPELPVIAAGSLLEFVLEDHTFSMPVGRINYMHLEPLSFEEFLLACGQDSLLDFLKSFNMHEAMPLALHEQLLAFFKEFLIVGGMPAVVKSWQKEHTLDAINQMQSDLLSTFRDDFAKYRKKIPLERLDEVFTTVPRLLGEKFVYSRVNPTIASNTVRESLNLLCSARVCHKVTSSAANGIPLASEINPKFVKVLMLDSGLCSSSLGLTLHQIDSLEEIALINRGGIAEQVVGQLLRTINPPYIEPELYYWHRNKKGSQAEVDYVIQHRNQVIPIEVKAGSTGALRSLHEFMGTKQLALAVRVNSDFPSLTPVEVKNAQGKRVKYKLLSVPFYLVGQVHRLLSDS